MKSKIIVMVSFLVAAIHFQNAAAAEPVTVFAGIPSIKVSEGGVERSPENLPRERAVNLGCVISQIGDKFYWASRENKEMSRRQSGAFITFQSIDGSGYVRTIDPSMKKQVESMGATEAKFDYVEHLLIGLKTVTYYGTFR